MHRALRLRLPLLLPSMVLTAWIVTLFIILRNSFMDDAYIGFTYVKHLLAGQGLTFNVGERVEGVTNMGWLLLLAGPAKFISIQVVAKAASLLAVIGTILTMWTLLDHTRPELTSGTRFLVLASIATSFDFLYFSFLGMETALLGLILTGALLLEARNRSLIAALLLSVAYLVHPEAVIILPTWIVMSAVVLRTNIRRMLFGMLIYVTVVGAFEVLRVGYYGLLLPNTFTAKPALILPFLARLIAIVDQASSVSNISKPFGNPLALLALGAGMVVLRRRSGSVAILAGAIIVTGYTFAVYARQDWTTLGRYFAPYAPVTSIVFVSGLDEILGKVCGSPMRVRLQPDDLS